MQQKKKMKIKKDKRKKEEVQPEEVNKEDDFRLHLSQTQESVSLLATREDDQTFNMEAFTADVSLEEDDNLDEEHLPDGQVMTEGGSPDSTLRGTELTISFEVDSIGGVSRRESFMGVGDEHEELEGVVNSVLEWEHANEVWNEEEDYSSMASAEIDPGETPISPLKQAIREKINQVKSGVSQVKSMVVNIEGKQRKENEEKKGEAIMEKERRMQETKLAREKSIQESRSDFVRRMSQNDNGI